MEHVAHPTGLNPLDRIRRQTESRLMADIAEHAGDPDYPEQQPAAAFVLDNRASLGSLVVFVVMMALFFAATRGSSPTGASTAPC